MTKLDDRTIWAVYDKVKRKKKKKQKIFTTLIHGKGC